MIMFGLAFSPVAVTADDVNWQERALKAEAQVEVLAYQLGLARNTIALLEKSIPKPAQNGYAEFLRDQRIAKQKAKEAEKAEAPSK